MYASRSKMPRMSLDEDGNVYAIIGRVRDALRKAGFRDDANEFRDRAFEQESYDDVLILVQEYVVPV